jgi:hypothetical protein
MRRTFKAVLASSNYANGKRQTAQRTRQLCDELGPYLNGIYARMLRIDVLEVAKDPLMRMSPVNVSPELCESFNFQFAESPGAIWPHTHVVLRRRYREYRA